MVLLLSTCFKVISLFYSTSLVCSTPNWLQLSCIETDLFFKMKLSLTSQTQSSETTKKRKAVAKRCLEWSGCQLCVLQLVSWQSKKTNWCNRTWLWKTYFRKWLKEAVAKTLFWMPLVFSSQESDTTLKLKSTLVKMMIGTKAALV